ncbi:hypothetical protein KFK09_007321 [Dendrobium nobile]|uniref:Uncharacterized protein n=1 Tax=Dendrobium nobile TaxID=94219 RepID=A0A8T3BTS1_DENNO|nr:hypothetical protein KFK09_007321 [Dendrobium nobile]
MASGDDPPRKSFASKFRRKKITTSRVPTQTEVGEGPSVAPDLPTPPPPPPARSQQPSPEQGQGQLDPPLIAPPYFPGHFPPSSTSPRFPLQIRHMLLHSIHITPHHHHRLLVHPLVLTLLTLTHITTPIRCSMNRVDHHDHQRWLPEYSTRIRSNFERRGATRLRDMFTDIRKSGQRPNWIGEGVWADLSSAWATPEFIKMREQNKQNRASDCGGLGSSLHTGGSVPHTEHRRRLDDFLRVRESRQSTGEGSSSGSAHTSEYHTWSEVVGGRQRGRVYGMGSQAFAIEGSSYTSAFHDPSGAEESVNGYNRRQPPVRYRRSNAAVRRSNEPDDARFNRRNTAGTLTGGFPAVTVPAAEPPKDRRLKFRWSPAVGAAGKPPQK